MDPCSINGILKICREILLVTKHNVGQMMMHILVWIPPNLNGVNSEGFSVKALRHWSRAGRRRLTQAVSASPMCVAFKAQEVAFLKKELNT